MSTVIFLESKSGGHYGTKETVGGQHKCLSCMVIMLVVLKIVLL